MPRPVVDLTGKIFGKLTVLPVAPERRIVSGTITLYWTCQCVCGNQRIYASTSLKSGSTQSCGCFRAELQRNANRRKNPEGRRQDKEGYIQIRVNVPGVNSGTGRPIAVT